MARRTKIIATIGPASESDALIKDLAVAGMDVARIGLAHGTIEDALAKYDAVRRVEKEVGRPLGIMVDLPGPKVRAGAMPEEGLPIEQGEEIHLFPSHDEPSRPGWISVDHEGLLHDLHAGDRVTFGDGAAMGQVIDRDTDSLIVQVTH